MTQILPKHVHNNLSKRGMNGLWNTLGAMIEQELVMMKLLLLVLLSRGRAPGPSLMKCA